MEPFSEAHRAQTHQAPSPREPEGPQEIYPGTLTGRVFGDFGVKHECTTDSRSFAPTVALGDRTGAARYSPNCLEKLF